MKNITFILLAALALSCQDKPGEKTAQQLAFDKLNPESAEYKTELAKLINEQPDDYEVTFDHFHKKGNRSYIAVNIEGDGLSATEDILLQNDEPKVITEHEGKGYGGAQLEGLKVTVSEADAKPVLLFQSVKDIID